jgi:hypothetical protein
MLEAVVGTTAALLVLLGLAVAFAPVRPRSGLRLLVRHLHERPPPAPLDRRELVLPGLHPTTQRAVQSATRAAAILRSEGFEEEAQDLRAAARQVGQHEAEGQRALRRAQVRQQSERLED